MLPRQEAEEAHNVVVAAQVVSNFTHAVILCVWAIYKLVVCRMWSDAVHPERGEGSLSRAEMLRCAQHDTPYFLPVTNHQQRNDIATC
jgi:hypothetical protein